MARRTNSGRNRLLRLIRDVVFVRRLEVDERTSRLDRPVRRGRALRHPSQRALVVAMTALVAVDVDPRFVQKLLQHPVHAAGVQHDRRVRALAEDVAADALPLVGALSAVVAVARKNPRDVIPLPARDHVLGEPDRLAFRQGETRIHLRIRAAADGPEQDRDIQQAGAIQRDGLFIEALEERRVDRDALVAGVGTLVQTIASRRSAPFGGDPLHGRESLKRPDVDVVLPLFTGGAAARRSTQCRRARRTACHRRARGTCGSTTRASGHDGRTASGRCWRPRRMNPTARGDPGRTRASRASCTSSFPADRARTERATQCRRPRNL